REELLGHLKSYDTAKRRAAEQIWPGWLNRAQRIDITRCHILDSGQRFAFRIETLRLQPIDRLVGSQRSWQNPVDNHTTTDGVTQVQRRFIAWGLNRDQRGMCSPSLCGTPRRCAERGDGLGQACDRRRL